MTRTRRSLRSPPAQGVQPHALSVPTPSDRLRRAFPPGSGKTPWATKPGARWTCETCGASMEHNDLAVATIRWLPWGRQVRWRPSEWRHSVHTGVLREGGPHGAEAALRVVLEADVAAARWNAESQKIERRRGRLAPTSMTRQ